MGTLCDNSLYLSLRELYDRFLYGYLNLKVDEELKKVSGVLNSLDFKDEENTLKVKKFVTNLILLFDNVTKLGMDEQDMYNELKKAQNILELCSKEENITSEFYNSNHLKNVPYCKSDDIILSINPLFEFVRRIFDQKFPNFKATKSESSNVCASSSSNSKDSIIPKIQNLTDTIETRRTIPRSRGVNSTNTNNSRTSHTEQTERKRDKREEKIRRRMFGY